MVVSVTSDHNPQITNIVHADFPGKMLDNPVVVNRPTGRMIRITKTTGRGSDYYGLCELCGGHMSECFTSRLARERRREDGSLYPDLAGVLVFAHEACIDKLSLSD